MRWGNFRVKHKKFYVGGNLLWRNPTKLMFEQLRTPSFWKLANWCRAHLRWTLPNTAANSDYCEVRAFGYSGEQVCGDGSAETCRGDRTYVLPAVGRSPGCAFLQN